MAAAGIMADYQPMDSVEAEQPPRKKFKVSDLPLTSGQRAAIDGLVHTIKKKGLYDTVRKQVWAQYTESVSESRTFPGVLKIRADACALAGEGRLCQFDK